MDVRVPDDVGGAEGRESPWSPFTSLPRGQAGAKAAMWQGEAASELDLNRRGATVAIFPPSVSRKAQAVLACLAGLAGRRPKANASALAELVNRRGLERASEVLFRWAG